MFSYNKAQICCLTGKELSRDWIENLLYVGYGLKTDHTQSKALYPDRA